MTRRRRRATSGPQHVGSGEGLTSTRPAVTEPGAQPQTQAQTQAEAEGDARAAQGDRHTSRRRTEQTRDDTDEGWGERGDDEAGARWLRENRPPHWD